MPISGLLRPTPRSHRPWRRLAAWGVGGALVLALTWLTWWFIRARQLEWAIQHGQALQTRAQTPAELEAAVVKWEQETQHIWRDDADDLLHYAFRHHPLSDARVRRLLTRVTDADFGDRVDDWLTWYEDREHLRRASTPVVHISGRLKLKRVWSAPIGLTTWFSTILPIDGQIYVSSLGRAFEDPADEYDGVVVVDGASGKARYLLEPSGHGPRDILGIAAGDDALYAACRNGLVYCLAPDGRVHWTASVGAPCASIPMTFDATGNGRLDVAVVSQAGRLVTLNRANGRTVWVANVASAGVRGLSREAQRSAPRPLLLAGLSLGNVLGEKRPQIAVASANGDLRLVSASDGRVLWTGQDAAGGLGGAVCGPGANPERVALYLGDLEGRIWTAQPAGRSISMAALHRLESRGPTGLVSTLRTLAERRDAMPWVVACAAGEFGALGGSVALLSPQGVQWRVPLSGTAWATPALTDLTRDGRPEVIVASFEAREGQSARGYLTVYSAEGRVMTRVAFDAALECSPVVADVTGDGTLELLAADRAGWLHCFATETVGPVEWGMYGGDARNTRNAASAYAYGQTPCRYQWRWLSGGGGAAER